MTGKKHLLVLYPLVSIIGHLKTIHVHSMLTNLFLAAGLSSKYFELKQLENGVAD